jgi:hypothetical protein
MPQKWQTIAEELYELERVWPTMTPLADAYNVESKKRYPIIWTNTHGKPRSSSHRSATNTEIMEDPVYLALVTRGLLWTVARLTADGKPTPGYAAR